MLVLVHDADTKASHYVNPVYVSRIKLAASGDAYFVRVDGEMLCIDIESGKRLLDQFEIVDDEARDLRATLASYGARVDASCAFAIQCLRDAGVDFDNPHVRAALEALAQIADIEDELPSSMDDLPF